MSGSFLKPALALVGTAALALLAVSCLRPRLADWARSTHYIAVGEEGESEAFPYRRLTPADFRATEPPPIASPEYLRQVGALLCGRIVPRRWIRARRVESGYEGYVDELSFRAVFVPECSWWNYQVKPLAAEYVLAHEQIHFALYEITARRLNAEASRIVQTIRAPAPDREAAREGAARLLDAEIARGLAELERRNARFDEDTSMALDGAKQAKWARRVELELAALASLPTPGPTEEPSSGPRSGPRPEARSARPGTP